MPRPSAVFSAAPYVPSSNYTGQGGSRILRGKNLMLRGSASGGFYYEVYAGSYDLSETIAESALTGTLSFSPSSRTITGSGTSFTTECHLGQFLQASNGEFIVVDRIDSDTSMEGAEVPLTTVSGGTVYRAPVLFEVNKKRGSLLRGNALQFDKGTILAVGAGVLRLNGSALPGTSLTATKSPKLTLFDGTNFGTGYTLGFAAPTGHSVAATTGGAKGMVAGEYGIAIAAGRAKTNGYGELSTVKLATIVDDGRLAFTFPAMATGQDAWYVFGTLFNGTANANGARVLYYVTKLTTSDVSAAGGTVNLEWIDAEIGGNELASYNNFSPPECEFVQTLEGVPIYFSCFGEKSGTTTGGKSPGPRVVPSKPQNIEAALTNVSITSSPPETIISAVPGPARIYAGCPSSVQIVQASGNATVPITMRQFWRSGVKNPYNLIFINNRLHGMSTAGPTRSAFDGEAGSEEHVFAAPVAEITQAWVVGKTLLVHDPKNNVVCHIHSANHKNSDGYWVSVIQMFSLQHEAWSIPVYIESTTADRIISGVAKVEHRMYFIAGGRVSGGTRSWKTYEFDRASGESVSWYAAWGLQEVSEFEEVEIEAVRVTAKAGASNVQIYGVSAADDIVVADIESGDNSTSGDIALPATTTSTRYQEIELNLPEAGLFTVRIEGTWNGATTKDRVDEVALLPVLREGER